MLSIAQNDFLNRLTHNPTSKIPVPNPNMVLNSGALALVNSAPPEFRDQVLGAYNEALVDVFYIALGLASLIVVSTLGIECKPVKEKGNRCVKLGNRYNRVNFRGETIAGDTNEHCISFRQRSLSVSLPPHSSTKRECLV